MSVTERREEEKFSGTRVYNCASWVLGRRRGWGRDGKGKRGVRGELFGEVSREIV